MEKNMIEEAIANVASALLLVKKYYKSSDAYSDEAINLLEKVYLQLLEIHIELEKINFLYVS
jgi:hypothetical protein